jgi:ABC-type Co2+ transport system permease subunit
MHIEPGIVSPEKIILSYVTAVGAIGYLIHLSATEIKKRGLLPLLIRSLMSTVLVFCFFQVLPHYPIGVSEVHLILGSTLFLVFGPAAAAFGLTVGLLTQGIFFAPFDLPQIGMNITTLLVPLYAMSMIAKKFISEDTAYVDLKYSQVLKLSLLYQGGVVMWVGFWAVYGQGFAMENIQSIATFGLAYMSVVLLEPLIDVGILAIAKYASSLKGSMLVQNRLYQAS